MTKPQPAFRILGVWLDENFNFDYHVSIVATTKFKVPIKRQKRSISESTEIPVQIHPYFLYCLNVYSCTHAKNIKKLYRLQKRCIRLICNFYSLNIPPFPDLIQHIKT